MGKLFRPVCREIQTNTPNVGVVQQQTQMAESMVTRNAQLAEESIRSVLQASSLYLAMAGHVVFLNT